MGCAAAPKPVSAVYQSNRIQRVCDCFAAGTGINPLATGLIVPTLRVGMHPVTLRVTKRGTQSVRGGIPTQSMGTIGHC